MNSDSYLGYFEFIVLGLVVAAWFILEWQGKRLDKKREQDKLKQQGKT